MVDAFLFNKKVFVEITFELDTPSPSSESLDCIMEVGLVWAGVPGAAWTIRQGSVCACMMHWVPEEGFISTLES